MNPMEELAARREAVGQAVANLQARGISPRSAVIALYEQYGRGEVSRVQVQALMHQRATALLRVAHAAIPSRAESSSASVTQWASAASKLQLT